MFLEKIISSIDLNPKLLICVLLKFLSKKSVNVSIHFFASILGYKLSKSHEYSLYSSLIFKSLLN